VGCAGAFPRANVLRNFNSSARAGAEL